MCRRKYLWILLGVMLGLETLFALLWSGPKDFASLASLMTTTMPIGIYLAVLLADIVASDPAKTGALKNEAAFGLSRSCIYMGKLASAAIVALLFCTVLFAWYLGGCWLFFQHTGLEATRAGLGVLIYVAAASLPLWLGTLALSYLLYMTMKNEFAGAVAVFFFLTAGEGILGILAMLKLGPVSQVAGVLASIVPSAQFGKFNGALNWRVMAENWAVGLGWVICTSIVGMMIFKRRELR